jgi:hypothetical protein
VSHLRKLVSHWKVELSIWSGWIIEELMGAKSHVGYLLGNFRELELQLD